MRKLNRSVPMARALSSTPVMRALSPHLPELYRRQVLVRPTVPQIAMVSPNVASNTCRPAGFGKFSSKALFLYLHQARVIWVSPLLSIQDR